MVSSTSPVEAGGIEPSKLPKISKPLEKKVGKVFKWVKEILILGVIASSSARSIAHEIEHVSSSVKKLLTATRGFVVLLFPFSVQEVVNDILAIGKGVIAFPTEKKVADIARATFNLVVHLDWVAIAVSSSCKIIYAFAKVSAKVVNWTEILGVVSFFVDIIALGLTAESAGRRGKLVYDYQQVLRKIDTALPEEKAKILAEFLKEFDEKGIQVLLKKLMISKKALYQGRKVTDRVISLAKDLLVEPGKKKAEIEEAEAIVRTLVGRAKLLLTTDVAAGANQVAALVGGGFATFAPILPVGFIILASTGIISLLMMGGKFMFITKNPFDPEAKSRAIQLVQYISNGISHLRDRLDLLAQWPHAHPSTAKG